MNSGEDEDFIYKVLSGQVNLICCRSFKITFIYKEIGLGNFQNFSPRFCIFFLNFFLRAKIFSFQSSDSTDGEEMGGGQGGQGVSARKTSFNPLTPPPERISRSKTPPQSTGEVVVKPGIVAQVILYVLLKSLNQSELCVMCQ